MLPQRNHGTSEYHGVSDRELQSSCQCDLQRSCTRGVQEQLEITMAVVVSCFGLLRSCHRNDRDDSQKMIIYIRIKDAYNFQKRKKHGARA